MKLKFENRNDIDNITLELIDSALESLGTDDNFAILEDTDSFIQTARSNLEGFCLEYQNNAGEHYLAEKADFSLDDVKKIFKLYLAKDVTWRDNIKWELLLLIDKETKPINNSELYQEFLKRIGTENLSFGNKDYYKNVFEKKEIGSLFMKWNWAAFLFGPLWLAYRKMYNIFLIILILYPLIEIGSYFIFGIAPFSIYFLSHLFLGLFGNSLYGRWLKEILKTQNNIERSLISIFLGAIVMFCANLPMGPFYGWVAVTELQKQVDRQSESNISEDKQVSPSLEDIHNSIKNLKRDTQN